MTFLPSGPYFKSAYVGNTVRAGWLFRFRGRAVATRCFSVSHARRFMVFSARLRNGRNRVPWNRDAAFSRRPSARSWSVAPQTIR